MYTKFKDLDVVQFVNGREGTVLHVVENGSKAYVEFESDDDIELADVNDVKEALWINE